MPANTSLTSGFLVANQNFHRFVTERYGHRYPDGGKGWQTIIREHANDEQDAFRLFFELVAECEQSQPVAMKSRVRRLLCAKPFQPFVICMIDRTEHRVTDPSFVMASPNEQSSIIVEEMIEDRMHYLSPSLIYSVELTA